jgi:hypothetical protein
MVSGKHYNEKVLSSRFSIWSHHGKILRYRDFSRSLNQSNFQKKEEVCEWKAMHPMPCPQYNPVSSSK